MLKKYRIDVVVHVMIGLPNESIEDLKNTINFVNNHIDAVEELCEIYATNWTAMCEEVDMWSLIQEVA